jgi:hypothetical protein
VVPWLFYDFQVVPLFLKSFHFSASDITFWNFLKIPSVFKGLNSQLSQKVKTRIFCYVYFRQSQARHLHWWHIDGLSHWHELKTQFHKIFSQILTGNIMIYTCQVPTSNEAIKTI